MSSDTTNPMPASKWADTEKIALLVSIIKTSGGKIKWADVSVPAGRTTQSSAKMYSEMMKASTAVAMTEGANITPSKKRGRKDDDDGATTPTEKKKRGRKNGDDGATIPTKKKKRGRKPKNAAPSPSMVNENQSAIQKVKVEAKEADGEEDVMIGETGG